MRQRVPEPTLVSRRLLFYPQTGWASCRTLTAPDAREGGGGENNLHRDLIVLSDFQGEVEAGAVLAPFEIAHGLVVDAESLGEVPPRNTPFGAQHGYAVVRGLAHQPARCIAFSRLAATVEPDSRCAILRSTTGARTRPTTAQIPSTPMVSRCLQESPISTLTSVSGRNAERIPSPTQ